MHAESRESLSQCLVTWGPDRAVQAPECAHHESSVSVVLSSTAAAVTAGASLLVPSYADSTTPPLHDRRSAPYGQSTTPRPFYGLFKVTLWEGQQICLVAVAPGTGDSALHHCSVSSPASCPFSLREPGSVTWGEIKRKSIFSYRLRLGPALHWVSQNVLECFRQTQPQSVGSHRPPSARGRVFMSQSWRQLLKVLGTLENKSTRKLVRSCRSFPTVIIKFLPHSGHHAGVFTCVL